ncbi:MAG: hypothetical protein RIM99_01590 [Cyclobacteriaceae bacterium]
MPKVSGFTAFITKLKNWEYWPFSVLYFPVFFYFAWLAVKSRSVLFFTASNPTIEFGGMFGERKSDIFSILPDKYIPTTRLIHKGDQESALAEGRRIGYPLIAKPDIGERGVWVKKIEGENEMLRYTESCPVDFLLQELITYPVELGIFLVKYPGEKGKVTSIVRKEFLEVKGDGQATIMELLKENPRAILTADLSSDFLKQQGSRIPEKNECVLIEPVGNHCKGTKFLNDEHEIDESLNVAMNKIADEIPDFFFGRFDLKCRSIADLKELKNFSILELNGAGAEPGHIYQPGYSLFRAYKDILWHLKVLADISVINHQRGIPFWSLSQGYKKWKEHRNHNRLLYQK